VNNDNFTVWDDSADDIDDLGDTWTLTTKDSHSGGMSYRCTNGDLLYDGAADSYIGRSELIEDDTLTWAPLNKSRRDLRDKACAEFSFWHKTKGEYFIDEAVIPIDYGHIAYSLDDGATWTEVPLSKFVAYDNGWEQWTIYFINTLANDGEYDMICDGCQPDCDNPNKLVVETEFPANAFLQVKFMWHVDPCNEYEGWYIDDICLDITDEYELKMVHQTHEIYSLPGCDPNVGPVTTNVDFPLNFDPEPETWYYLIICGQVFSPQNCEENLENNCLDVQFQVKDIHDIRCADEDCGEEDLFKPGDCGDGEADEFSWTPNFENVGTFAEKEFPVDLLVGKKSIEMLVDEDFETDPGSRWGFYYFTGTYPEMLWRWTEGDPGIPDLRSAEDQPVGHESLICADEDLRPELKMCIGNLLTNDEIYDFEKTHCCEEATLEFAVKYAMPYGEVLDPLTGNYEDCGVWGTDFAGFMVHPTEGPDSAYWYLISGMYWYDGDWTADWEWHEIDLIDMQESFQYEICGEKFIPPIEFGWGVFSNSDGNKVNPDAEDCYGNPYSWGGFMIDAISVETKSCISPDVVDTDTWEAVDLDDNGKIDEWEMLQPGETTDDYYTRAYAYIEHHFGPHRLFELYEKQIVLNWTDIEFCEWCAIADANLPTDVNPENDTCCTQLHVTSDCTVCHIDDDSADLTCCDEGTLWSLCTTDEGDDTVLTATKDFGDYRIYEPNMDDSFISKWIDVTNFQQGAWLEFDTYFKFFSWCLDDGTDDPKFTCYDDGRWDWIRAPEGPWEGGIHDVTDTGDFGEVYAREVIDKGAPGPSEDDEFGHWVRLQSPQVGQRLWWDDYYLADDHCLCDDGLPRYFDWDTVQFEIPAFLCDEVDDVTGTAAIQIRFRMVSNDLEGDDTDPPYMNASLCVPDTGDYEFAMDESEGWYIDDVKIYGDEVFGISEGFEGGVIPAGWTQKQYSGTGEWVVHPYGGPTYYYPPGTGTYFATADSDTYTTDVFDVELFTPSMNLNIGTLSHVLDLEHSFEDYAGMGEAHIATYSGGTDAANLEEVLLYMDLDGDDGDVGFPGAHFNAVIDVSGYANPNDVYLGFWYSTNGGTFAWSYSIDDIEMLVLKPDVTADLWCTYDPPLPFIDDFEDGMDTFWMGGQCSKADDWWTFDETTGNWIFDHAIEGPEPWPTWGPGIDDALYYVIDLCEEWSFAEFVVDHTLYLGPYDHAYIEISTDFDPDSPIPMCQQDAEWVVMWERMAPCTQGEYTSEDYQKVINLQPYLDAGLDYVTVRFRYTSLGDQAPIRAERWIPWESLYTSNYQYWEVYPPMIRCKLQTFTDETPPVTTLVFDELNARVTLYANDPGMHATGVAATYYKIDGGAQQEGTTFTVQNGQHTVEYWSVDNAGNEESHKTATVTVDTEPPTISITEPTAGIYLLGNKVLSMGSKPICIGKVTIKADASDDGTGVQMVTFDVDGDTGYATSAPYQYTYRGVKFGSAKATATAYDGKGLTAQDSVDFTIFSLGLL
jgi:hypothetical protein